MSPQQPFRKNLLANIRINSIPTHPACLFDAAQNTKPPGRSVLVKLDNLEMGPACETWGDAGCWLTGTGKDARGCMLAPTITNYRPAGCLPGVGRNKLGTCLRLYRITDDDNDDKATNKNNYQTRVSRQAARPEDRDRESFMAEACFPLATCTLLMKP